MPSSRNSALKIAVIVLRVLMGAIFIYAGYVKLAEPWQLFAAGIADYEVVPMWAAKFLAHTLPWFEVLIGLLLIVGRWFRVSTVSTSLLLLVFFSLMVRAFAGGKEINCGCFGPNELISWKTLVRDGSMLAVSLFLAAVAPNFLTAENLLNVLRNVSMQGLIALGMTLVIIAGEIDLSVGSMVAFSGCLTAWLTGALGTPGAGLPVPLAVGAAILLSLAAGCLSGSLAGLLRNRFGVPSFISTLALLTALSGAAELITNGFPLTPFPGWYNFIGGGYLLGIPFPALLFVIAFAGTHMLMNYTAFGRAVYAVGGNAEAARLSAINIRTVRTAVLALTATLAAASAASSATPRAAPPASAPFPSSKAAMTASSAVSRVR